MDWGAIIGGALLLGLAAIVLQFLWRLLLLVVVLGPLTYAGIVVGYFIAGITHDMIAGLFVAAVIAGLLLEAVRRVCTRRWASGRYERFDL